MSCRSVDEPISNKCVLMEKMSADVEFYGQSVVMRQTTSTGLFSSEQKTTCLSEELNKPIYSSSCNSAEQVTTALPKRICNIALVLFSPQSDGFPIVSFWVSPVKFSNGLFLGHNW